MWTKGVQGGLWDSPYMCFQIDADSQQLTICHNHYDYYDYLNFDILSLEWYQRLFNPLQVDIEYLSSNLGPELIIK